MLAGTACASLTGNSELLPASLCILFVVFAQLSANFYYRYHDLRYHCGTDIDRRIRQHATNAPLNVLREASFAMLLLAVMIGCVIATMGGWWTVIVGLFIFIATYLTCGGSAPLLRTPFGPVSSFILFGPVCVLSTCLLQVTHEEKELVNWSYMVPALYMSVIIGLMAVNATLLYGYANYMSDLRNSKVTLSGAIGRKASRMVVLVNGFLYTIITIAMCVQLDLHLNGVDMIPSFLCLGVDLYIWWQMKALPRHELGKLVDLGNFNVFLMGLLSYIVYEITGATDISRMTILGL